MGYVMCSSLTECWSCTSMNKNEILKKIKPHKPQNLTNNWELYKENN